MVSHDVLFLQSTKVLSGFHPDDGETPSEEESQFQHTSDDCGSPCAGSCASQAEPALGHKGQFEFKRTPRAPSGTGGFVERAMCSPFQLGDEKNNKR